MQSIVRLRHITLPEPLRLAILQNETKRGALWNGREHTAEVKKRIAEVWRCTRNRLLRPCKCLCCRFQASHLLVPAMRLAPRRPKCCQPLTYASALQNHDSLESWPSGNLLAHAPEVLAQPLVRIGCSRPENTIQYNEVQHKMKQKSIE